MAIVPKKPSPDVIQHWITRVNEEGRGLSQWELGFMDSITEQFERRGELSDAQSEKLERIYSERTK